MKTVKDIKTNLQNGETWYVIKKGAAYITERNGEFARTKLQSEALAFPSELNLEQVVQSATVDDRNARIIGRSYNIVPVSRKPQ